jgi:non-ribosomal peptide synthetase component F
LAILSSGAAHVCIDPAFPDDQIQEILADSGALALMTDSNGVARAEQSQFGIRKLIDVAEHACRADEILTSPPRPEWLTQDSLAYIIYTSGTTGRPKGVMIAHKSISTSYAPMFKSSRFHAKTAWRRDLLPRTTLP